MHALIDGQSIAAWAAKIGAFHQLPRLIRRLIWATLNPSEIKSINFPAGADVQLPGFDGQLETNKQTPWIPKGKSVWEISVQNKSSAKAKKDYEKRRGAFQENERAQISYVAVSAQRWTDAKKNEWIYETADDGWKEVRLLTAAELAQWLDRAPALAFTFAEEIGRLPAGVMPLDLAWKAWSQRSNPVTTQEVVLVGRAEQHTKLVEGLATVAGAMVVEADSPNEAYGFILAVLTGSDDEGVRDRLASKSLVVTDPAWARALSEHHNLIVIQQSSELDLTAALRDRHHVLVPLGREDVRGRDSIRLERASRFDFARALEKMRFSGSEASRLAYECGRSVTIFHRRRPAVHIEPPKWRNDPVLLPVLMAGRWDRSNTNDCAVLVRLAGVERYEELQQRLAPILNVSDPPLIRVGDTFTLTAPADAFELCAPFLTKTNFEDLALVVNEVFSEIDPALALPPQRQPYAAMYGSIPKHSRWLRHGLAETLLLIAVRGETVELDLSDPQGFVNRMVQDLPGLADDTRLLESLDSELPMLMEAAPEPFLQALERLLEGQQDAVRDLLTEGPGLLMGRPKHIGLLWGLERLAWAPEHLSRVALILTRMAELDPGGKWVNRPINSLRTTFLAWRPSTNAPLRMRLQTLDLLLGRHPGIGWELLIALLPKLQDSASNTAKPRWRDNGSDQAETLTSASREEAYAAFVTRALDRVGNDPERWKVILDALPLFQPADRERAIGLLDRLERETQDPQKRSELEDVIAKFVRGHERLPEASWALPSETLAPFKGIVDRLSPDDLVKRHAWLFENHWLALPRQEGQSREEIENSARKMALREILDRDGIGGAVTLASNTNYPGLVLNPLLEMLNDVDATLDLLARRHEFRDPLAYLAVISIVALTLFGQDWRERIACGLRNQSWSEAEEAALLSRWPFDPSTWGLAEAQGAPLAEAYWKTCWTNLRELDGHDLQLAVDRLFAAGRALELPFELYERWEKLPAETWFRIIDAHAEILRQRQVEGGAIPDLSWLGYVIEHLAKRGDADEGEVARREYDWLPLVVGAGRSKDHVPALYCALARDPEFFLQLLKDAYRREGEPPEDESSDDQRSRADAAHRILMHWRHAPGFQQTEKPDAEALKRWVREARRLAVDSERREIADLMIGHVLAYAPNDADDGAWPHRAVREVIEEVASVDLESGVRSEQFNKRGTSTRGHTEGGAQERTLAAEALDWATVIGARWPRTERLLRSISEMWAREARREDEEAARRKLDF